MNPFSTKSPDTVQKLTQESQTILDTFMKTVTNLNAVNERIETVKIQKQAEAEKLLEEKAELEYTQERNEKVATKIKAFFE
jgi:septal ring factor EnvC (AmiA/AmiB activator)